MFHIVINVLRGVRKRLFQYIGISFLLITIIATVTGLYQNGYRIKVAFYEVAENSVAYDYRVDVKKLSNYVDSTSSLSMLQNIMKSQFTNIQYPTRPDEQKIINNQIDSIKNTNIQNNTLPDNASSLDPLLRDYLCNWGINYKAILVNSLIETATQTNKNLRNYQTKTSFLKSFSFADKSKNLFYSFEDAFYNHNDLPIVPPNPEKDPFDFTPYRDKFNKIYITKGRKPINNNEVVINPIFAEKNGIFINSQQEFIKGQKMIVTGFGYSYWGITGDRTPDNINPRPEQTTQIFTTQKWFNQYLINNPGLQSKITTPLLLKVKNDDDFYANRLESIFSAVFNFNYGSVITANTNDIRGGAVEENFKMQDILFSSISFVILLVAVFIILSYVRKEIDLQKKQIGLIKSLGYNNWEISIGFTILIFFVTFLSANVGYGLGFLLQMQFNFLTNFGWYLPLPYLGFSIPILIISLIIVPLILTLASYWQSIARLSCSPLTLVYNQTGNVATKWIAIFKKPFYYWGFKARVTVAFALKSIGKLAIIFFTFLLSSFLLIFQIVATDIVSNKIDSMYKYIASDVYSQNNTIPMYNFDKSGKFSGDKIYSWTLNSDLSHLKQIKYTDFSFDSQTKLNNFMKLFNNLKGSYMNSLDVNKLYQKINSSDGPAFIDPTDKGEFTPFGQSASTIISILSKVYDTITQESGIDPKVTPFPGISIGQNIISSHEYPTINFSVTAPAQWINHNNVQTQNKKSNFVTGIYNNIEQLGYNSLAWKDWFNFKEEKNRDLDSIFYHSHALAVEKVSYIDNFGRKIENQNAYVIPAAITQPIASLNHYRIDDEVLQLINANNNFIPVIFKVKGIITNNLDFATYYINLDDFKHALNYVDDQGKLIDNIYNNVLTKQTNPILNNFVDIASTNNNYNALNLKNNIISINQSPVIFSLLKAFFNKLFTSLKQVLLITQWITIIALAFVLVIIINMILDNNILIIAMMKSLGYRINEINQLIVGSYIVTLIVAFFLGTIFAYSVWHYIIGFIALKSSIILVLPINVLTIISGFGLVFLVLAIGYSVGLYFIKYKPVTKLLQSE